MNYRDRAGTLRTTVPGPPGSQYARGGYFRQGVWVDFSEPSPPPISVDNMSNQTQASWGLGYITFRYGTRRTRIGRRLRAAWRELRAAAREIRR